MFPHNLFWYDKLPPEWIPYAIRVLPSLLVEFEALQNGMLKSFHSGSHFNWFDERIKEDKMPRGKRKNNDDAAGVTKRPTGNCTWSNVRLEDTDVHELSELEYSTDDLLGWIIEMSRCGADVGVKWADGGASRMAYCIAPDTDTGRTLVGVSAYGTDAWDALIALMYKVEVKLERNFVAGTDAPKPRFR